eukprot:9480273-Pyramimonas_sp.AAC.1
MVKVPELALSLVECGNDGRNADRLATPLQVLMEIHRKATANYIQCGDYKWDAVSQSIEAKKEWMQGHCRGMATFVEKWSGGDDAVWLKGLDAWSKTITHRASVPGSMFKNAGPNWIFISTRGCDRHGQGCLYQSRQRCQKRRVDFAIGHRRAIGYHSETCRVYSFRRDRAGVQAVLHGACEAQEPAQTSSARLRPRARRTRGQGHHVHHEQESKSEESIRQSSGGGAGL